MVEKIDLIKLTDADGQSWFGMQWGPGVTHTIPAAQATLQMCTPGMLHAAQTVEMALLLNGVQGQFDSHLRMWAAEAPEIMASDGLKVGVHTLTTTHEMELPGWFEDKGIYGRICGKVAGDIAEAALPPLELWLSVRGEGREMRLRPQRVLSYIREAMSTGVREVDGARYADRCNSLANDAAIKREWAACSSARSLAHAAQAAAFPMIAPHSLGLAVSQARMTTRHTGLTFDLQALAAKAIAEIVK